MNVDRKEPTPEEYVEAKIKLAMEFCPKIRPCEDCKWPKANGYVCEYCDKGAFGR